MVSHHPAKFFGHRHCSRGKIMVLVCHLISKYHLSEVLSYAMGDRPSRRVTILPIFVAIDTLMVEVLYFKFVT